ncbi:MAG: hypothetical protein LBG27_01745, partial [Spirochaetaceae bacterium]|nr:hypothetical protein [Spirochaetaceae bacterium]
RKKTVEFARSMKAEGESLDKIIRYTGLSAEEITKLELLPPLVKTSPATRDFAILKSRSDGRLEQDDQLP